MKEKLEHLNRLAKEVYDYTYNMKIKYLKSELELANYLLSVKSIFNFSIEDNHKEKLEQFLKLNRAELFSKLKSMEDDKVEIIKNQDYQKAANLRSEQHDLTHQLLWDAYFNVYKTNDIFIERDGKIVFVPVFLMKDQNHRIINAINNSPDFEKELAELEKDNVKWSEYINK